MKNKKGIIIAVVVTSLIPVIIMLGFFLFKSGILDLSSSKKSSFDYNGEWGIIATANSTSILDTIDKTKTMTFNLKKDTLTVKYDDKTLELKIKEYNETNLSMQKELVCYNKQGDKTVTINVMVSGEDSISLNNFDEFGSEWAFLSMVMLQRVK